MKECELIILAGGLGKRLKSITKDLVPKPMVEIKGKPFLEYVLNSVSKYGLSKIILSVGHKYEIIQDYFGSSFGDIPLYYSIEDAPLGTGGAIKKALEVVDSDYAFILNGDTYFDIDLNEILWQHIESTADMSIALKEMKNFDRYGCVELTNGKITGFKEKQFYFKGFINGGVYVVNRGIMRSFPTKTKFSFENDFLEKEVSAIFIHPYISKGYFIDIGIPEDFKRAMGHFSKKVNRR